MKRALDIVISVAGLIFLSPVLAAVALLVRIKLGTPVIFCQERPGYKRIPFRMYKFRTMTDARDESGNLLPDKERLTPFGEFLRKTSLDELPSLLNVIKCEMSLVGPRPLLMGYLPLYSAEQARRHDVRPGITGWAQINGRNNITWSEKFNLDVWYVDHQSFFLDLKIIALTFYKVIRRDDINKEGEATTDGFTGRN